MKHVLLCLAAVIAFILCPMTVSAYNPCADINEDGNVNVADVVYLFEWYSYGPPPPDGTGDIDYRQNHNLGDFHYMATYLFQGSPEGGCPPFPAYDLLPTDDTLLLPAGEIPAGSGTVSYPVTLVNRDTVQELMLPIVLNGLDSTTTSIEFEPVSLQLYAQVKPMAALKLQIISTSLSIGGTIPPGINTLGFLLITYNQPTAAPFEVDTTSFGDPRFLQYVYGRMLDYEIGVPTVITTEFSPYPVMSVEPDSLFFSTLTSIPITEPDTFTVVSSDTPFLWSLTHSEWLEVVPTEGLSGQKVAVRPVISGLSVGFHYGTISVTSYDAVGSPQNVIVELELKQTYPSFDANCDGQFDVDDIVVLVMYVFGGGDPPCDPCAGR